MDKRNVRNYIHTWIKDNNIYKYEFFFFETNQAGELPIILKRRNNTQTGHHNNQQDTTTGQTTIQFLSNSTQTTTGWIGTSTRLHNSNSTPYKNKKKPRRATTTQEEADK